MYLNKVQILFCKIEEHMKNIEEVRHVQGNAEVSR